MPSGKGFSTEYVKTELEGFAWGSDGCECDGCRGDGGDRERGEEV